MDNAFEAERYVVVKRSNIGDLVHAVRVWMRQGWLPQGGVAIWQSEVRQYVKPPIFAQAMVREESDVH